MLALITHAKASTDGSWILGVGIALIALGLMTPDKKSKKTAVRSSGRKRSANDGAVKTTKRSGKVIAPLLVIGCIVLVIVWMTHPEFLPTSMR
jgi:hypothetical protein